MKNLKIRMTFTEGILGTSPSDPELYERFIGDKAPDAPTLEEEIAAIGTEEVIEKGMTVFPRCDEGKPFLYDYQIKGFFKDACGMLARVKTSESSKLKAYKKIIDGLIFVTPRIIPMNVPSDISTCQRPLRAQTAQGERVALAISEEAPAGTTIELTIVMLDEKYEKAVREWLDYGILRGVGCWRNSGKGRFLWESVDE